jgi:hypothetical protein
MIMNLGTVQQLVRIILYSVGGLLFGQGVADGDLFQQLLGASGSIVAFAWWLVWERKREA